MSLLIVDETKCKQDGFCLKDCPRAIIRIKDKESYPELVPGGEQSCLTCGHCVAVCPHGAMSHTKVPFEDCAPLQKEMAINEPQVAQFLRSRRSIRQFKDRPVEKQKIQRLIEIARYAPTGSNTQLVEWRVFAGRDKIKELARLAADWALAMLEKIPRPLIKILIFPASLPPGTPAMMRS
jgi:ferredoxin